MVVVGTLRGVAGEGSGCVSRALERLDICADPAHRDPVRPENAPYASAVRSQRLLGNAVLLTHDGYGHVSYQDPSACVERARVAYLVDLVTPTPGTVCKADQRPFE